VAWLGFLSREASNQNGRPCQESRSLKKSQLCVEFPFIKVVGLRKSQFFILNIHWSPHLVVQRGRFTRLPTTTFVALTRILLHTQFEKESNTVKVMSLFV